MPLILSVIAAVILIGGGFFFVSAHPSPASVHSSVSAAPAQASENADAAAKAPAFSLEKLGGGTVALSDYAGKKAVVLDFWATWCPNCQRDIPHLEALYEKYQDKVAVVGIDLQEDPATVASFVKKYGMTYPVALDSSGAASQSYGARFTNYHILVGKDGTIVATVPGDISESDFQKLAAL